jgi:hypothetical protein
MCVAKTGCFWSGLAAPLATGGRTAEGRSENTLETFLVPVSTGTFPLTVVLAAIFTSGDWSASSIARASSIPGSVSMIMRSTISNTINYKGVVTQIPAGHYVLFTHGVCVDHDLVSSLISSNHRSSFSDLFVVCFPICLEPFALRLVRVSRLISSNHCPSIFDGFTNVLLQPMAHPVSCPHLFSRSDDYFCPSVLKVLSLLKVLSDVEGSMGRSDKMSVSVRACPALAFRRRRMGLWPIQ